VADGFVKKKKQHQTRVSKYRYLANSIVATNNNIFKKKTVRIDLTFKFIVLYTISNHK